MFTLRKIGILAGLLLAAFEASAQFPNPMDFNTATNASNTGVIPIGANDLHWSSALTNSLGPYVPAVACVAVTGWATSPWANCSWITHPKTCSANPSEHSCLGSIDEFYKLTFTLPANACNMAVSSPSAYCLSLDFFSDNWVWAVWVNGVLTYNNPTANPYNSWGFSPGNQLTAVLCNNWQAGTNNVIVHTKSGAPSFPGWSGFLAQANQTVNPSVGNPVSVTLTQTNVTCFGGNNGSASVSAIGGPPFTYTWLPSGGNSAVASNLAVGNYSVIVSNSGGCITTQTLSITQPPAITISVPPNTVICTGGTISLVAGGANTYTWSNGPTTATTMVSSTGVYSVVGTNTITGCTGTNTVQVQTGNDPTVTVNGPSPVCQGSLVTFSANGANSYTWNTGANTQSIQTIASSNTILSVTGFDAAHVCSNTQTISISVLPAPAISISGNTAICTGGTITLAANGADTYTWNNSSNNTNITVSPTINTSYSVAGTNTTTGCSNITNINVAVSNYPQLAAPDDSVCFGQSVTLTASGATSYTWNTGSNSNAISVAPSTNTFYTVSGSGTLPFCISSKIVSVTVLPAPFISVSSLPGNFICAGRNASLSATGANAFVWSTGSGQNSIVVNPVSTTIYTVTGTDFNLVCRSTRTVSVNVKAPPAIFIKCDSTICDGETGTLTVSGADKYVWSTGDQSPKIEVVIEYNKVYSVVGTDLATGCSNTGSIETVPSNACCEFWIPNTFTPNDDGINEDFGPKTLCRFTTYKITIFDRWGEKIFESDSPKKYWDGTYKGQVCKDDVYVYLIEGVKSGIGLSQAQKYLHLTGHVLLLR
jgi:gliding motility-associated-like protein